MNTIQLLLLVLLVLASLSALVAVAELVTVRQLRTDLTRWLYKVQARQGSEVTHGT